MRCRPPLRSTFPARRSTAHAAHGTSNRTRLAARADARPDDDHASADVVQRARRASHSVSYPRPKDSCSCPPSWSGPCIRTRRASTASSAMRRALWGRRAKVYAAHVGTCCCSCCAARPVRRLAARTPSPISHRSTSSIRTLRWSADCCSRTTRRCSTSCRCTCCSCWLSPLRAGAMRSRRGWGALLTLERRALAVRAIRGRPARLRIGRRARRAGRCPTRNRRVLVPAPGSCCGWSACAPARSTSMRPAGIGPPTPWSRPVLCVCALRSPPRSSRGVTSSGRCRSAPTRR